MKQISPYEYYFERNRLLIELENSINSSDSPHHITDFKLQYDKFYDELRISHDKINLCLITGDILED